MLYPSLPFSHKKSMNSRFTCRNFNLIANDSSTIFANAGISKYDVVSIPSVSAYIRRLSRNCFFTLSSLVDANCFIRPLIDSVDSLCGSLIGRMSSKYENMYSRFVKNGNGSVDSSAEAKSLYTEK